VLQEAPDKFFRRECPGLELFGLTVAILKRDVAVFQFQQAPVADGNAEDVRRQILERPLAGADGPTIDDPILFPGYARRVSGGTWLNNSGFFLSASRNLARKIFDSALTGTRNFPYVGRQSLPSSDKPPPATMKCRCG